MNIASLIDHTALKASTSLKDVEQLCAEARAHSFAAVCLPPVYVSRAVQLLQGTGIQTATVIGFPLGYTYTSTKRKEATEALEMGATELDMVISLAALKNGEWKVVADDIAGVLAATREGGALLKVIVESSLLSDAEVIRCCDICTGLGVDFIKTSTGFAEGGATVAAVQLMRAHLPSAIRIKASGGIRSYAFAKELVEAGADRLGCSASVSIVAEAASAGM